MHTCAGVVDSVVNQLLLYIHTHKSTYIHTYMHTCAGVGDSVVNQLLSYIDGVDSLNNVLIIGMYACMHACICMCMGMGICICM